MKTLLKTLIALMVTTAVPVMVCFFMIFLAAVILLLPVGTVPGMEDAPYLSGMLFLVVAFLTFSIPYTFAHVLLLGVPALLVGWYFRAIRWWSTLITAFLIGAVPAMLTTAFSPTGWSGNQYFWQSMEVIDLGMIVLSGAMMGFFGLIGGLTFWLLWRYWVSPESPAGRPLPLVTQALDVVEPQ